MTWIEESARVIKDLDANHLVTTGAEGKNGKDWKCTSAAILVRNNMLRHMVGNMRKSCTHKLKGGRQGYYRVQEWYWSTTRTPEKLTQNDN